MTPTLALPAETIRRVIRTATVSFLVLFLVLLGFYVSHRRASVREAETRLADLSDQVAADLAADLATHRREVLELAAEIAELGGSDDKIRGHLEALVRADSHVLEAGVAWRPGRSPDGRGLSAPHFGWKEGSLRHFRVEEAYDYTEAEWYREGLESGPIWGVPYYGQATRQWVVGCAVPVRLAGTLSTAPPDGVVRINFSMKFLHGRLTSLPLGSEGYVSIVKRPSTRVVYHPREDYIRGKADFYSIASALGDSSLVTLADRMARGEKGMLERPALMTGEVAWNFHRPIEGTDWSVVVIFIRDEMLGSARLDREQRIVLLVFLLLLVSSAILMWLKVETGEPRRLWLAAALVSICFLAGIGVIWRLSFDTRLYNDLQRGMIFNEHVLKQEMGEARMKAAQRGDPEPVFVPTGLFIRSLSLSGVSEALVNGTVWQTFSKATRDSVTWGVSFPSAIEVKTVESYRHENADGGVTVGWDFDVLLNQRFDFSRYPLDFQNIRIQLARRDFDRNVILVPDIGAYRSLIPQTLPGLDQSFDLLGWQVEKAFFNQQTADIETNFGLEHFVGGGGSPDLVHNMIVRRRFISPFIANIAPLFLIAGIAFALLAMIHSDKDRVQAYDARGGRVASTSAALFFAVLLAHIRLRGNLPGLDATIYIEYFYFVMYAACLGVVADVLLVAALEPPFWIRYRDNFLPKILFWPLLAVTFFAVTVRFFK